MSNWINGSMINDGKERADFKKEKYITAFGVERGSELFDKDQELFSYARDTGWTSEILRPLLHVPDIMLGDFTDEIRKRNEDEWFNKGQEEINSMKSNENEEGLKAMTLFGNMYKPE
ncbi:MAG: hypothetical protein GWN01_03790 [Nitrosopumilaceae archaeon]|nr:hypothetical protein [Nitrosopumilaceae archaeon]NIU86462.1 hypothetical protein [Nitrosopumilaceae archaeon]NIV65228.1 hypothetical protein [Nitrosopumilaceae archaeon]NIX60680.1 hypothetical protein [Nitrosopumilaceae archaeon]